MELPSTQVRLFTVLKNAVQSFEVLFFADTSGGVIGHNEEVVPLAIIVIVVQDALCFELITAGPPTLLNIAFQ